MASITTGVRITLAELLLFLSLFRLAFLDFGGPLRLLLRLGTTHSSSAEVGGGTGAQNKSPSPFAVYVSAPPTVVW